ncbi:MAG: hypothetical protein MMC33_002579 [Icmadophila ericetorum]|nr:hypothetical protein [Icmadophila ericetorum]
MGFFKFVLEVCDSAIGAYEDVLDASFSLLGDHKVRNGRWGQNHERVAGNPESVDLRRVGSSSTRVTNLENTSHRMDQSGGYDHHPPQTVIRAPRNNSQTQPLYRTSMSQRSTSTSSSRSNGNTYRRRNSFPTYSSRSRYLYDTWQDARPERRIRSSSAPQGILNSELRYLYDSKYEHERQSSVSTSSAASNRRNSLDGTPNPYLVPPPRQCIPSGIRGGHVAPDSRHSKHTSSIADATSPISMGYLSPDPRQSSFSSSSSSSTRSRPSSSSTSISSDDPSFKQYVSTSRRRNSIPAYYQRLRNQEDDFDAWETARPLNRTRSTSAPWEYASMAERNIVGERITHRERKESLPRHHRRGGSIGYAEDDVCSSRVAKLSNSYIPERAAPPLPDCPSRYGKPALESASITFYTNHTQSSSSMSPPSTNSSSSSSSSLMRLRPKPLKIHPPAMFSPQSSSHYHHSAIERSPSAKKARPKLNSLPPLTPSKTKPSAAAKGPAPLQKSTTASTSTRTRTRPFSPTPRSPTNTACFEEKQKQKPKPKLQTTTLPHHQTPHVHFPSPVVTEFYLLSPRKFSPSPLPLSPCRLKAYQDQAMRGVRYPYSRATTTMSVGRQESPSSSSSLHPPRSKMFRDGEGRDSVEDGCGYESGL